MSNNEDLTTAAPMRRLSIWGWLSIVAVIVVVACVIVFVIVPRANTSTGTNPAIHHSPTQPNSRSAPIWGPVVNVTQGLPDSKVDYYKSSTYVSGDLVIADVMLINHLTSMASMRYLRGIDAQTSKILWTLNTSSLSMKADATSSVAIDSDTGTLALVWASGESCYLAAIRLSDGRAASHSTSALQCPLPTVSDIHDLFVQTVDGYILVSIGVDTMGMPATSYNLFGFSETDLDHPVWQKQGDAYAYSVEDGWVCSDGCWSVVDGSTAPFGADARKGSPGISYTSFQDPDGSYRTYRIDRESVPYSWQQWSTTTDSPAPNTKPVTSQNGFNSIAGDNNDTLLMCDGSSCWLASMDGNRTYPPFQWTGYPLAVVFDGAMIVYDFKVAAHDPQPSLMISLASGQTTTLAPYRNCLTSSDLAYCWLQDVVDSPTPMEIQAIDASQGATPVWSSQPHQDGESFGGVFNVTDTTVFFDNLANQLQFASLV